MLCLLGEKDPNAMQPIDTVCCRYRVLQIPLVTDTMGYMSLEWEHITEVVISSENK